MIQKKETGMLDFAISELNATSPEIQAKILCTHLARSFRETNAANVMGMFMLLNDPHPTTAVGQNPVVTAFGTLPWSVRKAAWDSIPERARQEIMIVMDRLVDRLEQEMGQ